MSVIALQSAAAEGMLERDPARARTALQAVTDTAHDALAEMRRLMGVLEESDTDYAPQPGLARLGELAERSGAQLVEEGERPALSPGLDLTAYRVVQESLTNARKHGTGTATVRVRYSPEAVELDVRNAVGFQGESGGHGLAGMEERVRLYGGRLISETADGEFRVLARLPR